MARVSPRETTAAGVESIELVVFYDHEIREAVYHAGFRIEIGAVGKAIDRRVKALQHLRRAYRMNAVARYTPVYLQFFVAIALLRRRQNP